jgi:ribosomal protein S18 acetylase RimI-like enzyme
MAAAGAPPAVLELVRDREALERIGAAAVVALTREATDSTFYCEGLTPDQIAHNHRIVEISGPTILTAAAASHQLFAAALADGVFAGFVIATVHEAASRELDWLMVHPDFQGTDVAGVLMRAGMEWLGTHRPMWLNVIRYNERAIRFYRRFGFEIDPAARSERVVPQFVMRRPAANEL